MRKKTLQALQTAVVEKDVENAYRAEISHVRPETEWTSPLNTDGQAVWGTVRLLLEAKFDQDFKSKIPVCNVLSQMLLYLKRFEQTQIVLPNVLFVGDKNECFVLSTDAVRGFLDLDLDWSVAPSKGSPELTRALVQGFNLLPYVWDVDGNLEFKDVVLKIEALAAGSRHQERATLGNIEAMFLFWRDRIFSGKGSLTPTEQVDVFLRCLFQPTDVYLHPAKRGLLVVPGYDEGVPVNADAYRSFFDHFAQGYKPSEIKEFYAQKDRLVEDDSRRRQGAFFTPRLWVDEAHKEVSAALGKDWRKECVVWDPAAGTANLTRDYKDWGCLISSTAERPDVAVMRERKWGGTVFQYDFLNPGAVSPFFEEGVKNVIPDAVDAQLREAAKAGKRLVFFMNPPYGTANNAGTEEGDHKAGIAQTKVNDQMKADKIGASSRQLYAQFMYRCSVVAREYGFKQVTIGVFSMPKFMCSGSFRPFREYWYKRLAYRSGFLFQASHFADVSGAWGISFTVWNEGTTDTKADLPMALKDVKEFNVVTTGIKEVYNSDGREASKWVEGPQRGHVGDTPKFSSGLKVQDAWVGGSSPGSLGVLVSVANCVYKSGTSVFMLPGRPTGRMQGHFDLLPDNWARAVALYGARKLVPDHWSVHEDEYLRPNEKKNGYEQWVDDCHVYNLLDTKNNCTAMRDVSYKGKSWRIKNHWFWRTREQAQEDLDTKDTPTLHRDCESEPAEETEDLFQVLPTQNAWESTGDAYFAHLLQAGKVPLSPDAQRVLDLLNSLWLKSLPMRESYAAGKPELHLLTWDAGIYQLKHLWRDLFPAEWKELQEAFKMLSARLQSGVYEYGFLRK